jgi:hypothetical protein
VRSALLTLAVALCACPPPAATGDAGPEDAGVGLPVTPCDSPDDCRAAGVSAACRMAECVVDVPCGDDLECGLGERCVAGQCRFTGCTADADCATGRCLSDTFSCVECGRDQDCPAQRPVCNTASNTCVACRADADCARPGPSHCSSSGACVHCTSNDHCPNGLVCSSTNVCAGAGESSPCPEGTACAAGLACVNVGSSPVCLRSCPLYAPMCPMGQICYRLTYATSSSLVFEADGPIGVCFGPQAGLRGVREPCLRQNGGSNCQPNLQCVPETAQLALCRAYCNPGVSGSCPAGEVCRGFPGDFSGRPFGLCLPDSGFGLPCARDAQCRTGLSCQAYDDPSSQADVSPLCQFDVGAKPGLAPCAATALPDGGVLTADRACQSGRCVADPLFSAAGAPGAYCLATCKASSDCATDAGAGVCDADFAVTTPFGTTGTVRGCRPSCAAPADCQGFPGLTCRVRVVSTPSEPSYAATCSPPGVGGLPPGAPCASNSQCQSALCFLDDGRGVRRAGRCAAPCRAGDACSPDGGATMPIDCRPTTLLVTRGYDGRPGTADDTYATPSLCSGAPCTTDGDCGDGVCALDVDPAATPLGPLTRRCRAPTAGAKRGGEACVVDGECRSGVCGVLAAPSTGAGRACYEACAPGGSACTAPSMTCRAQALRVDSLNGTTSVDSCAP